MERIILPKLRNDLVFHEIVENGESMVIMQDTDRTVEQPIKMPKSLLPAIQKLDGMTDLNEFADLVKVQYGNDTTLESIIHFINELEHNTFY
jgi:hypothetical protein